MSKDLLNDSFGRFREIPLSLANMGHRVTGLCLSYKNQPQGWAQDGAVLWKSINATLLKLPGLFHFIANAARLAKDIDIIWACSDSFYGIIGQWLAVRYKIPLVFDLYDNFEYFLAAKIPIIKQLYRRTLASCSTVTCVSQPLTRLIVNYRKKGKIHVLPNAVRKDLFPAMGKTHCRQMLNLPMDAILIGTAGALHTNRGIEVLIDAFHTLETRYPRMHLVLAGPRSINLPPDTRIHDLGVLSLEKVATVINALDVAVVCNRDNEFGKYCHPQKAVEFMACDVPLVAAGVGALKELFKDHPDWLYQPGDSSALAKAIELRLIDRQTNYPPVPTWDDLAKQLEQIMLNLLNASA